MRRSILVLLVLTTFSALPAWAQSGANVTLQLPSYSTFGANTTVVVPDRGVSAVARERQSFYERTMYGSLRTAKHATSSGAGLGSAPRIETTPSNGDRP